MGDEPLYEIVEMDPLHKLREKGDDLEKEIDSIKKVLKDTVAVSKLHASADELVDKIIEMIKVSQDMVEAVAKSNQQISQQLQKSLDEMVRSNKDLSEKLNALLAFFAESSEAPSSEAAETTHPTGIKQASRRPDLPDAGRDAGNEREHEDPDKKDALPADASSSRRPFNAKAGNTNITDASGTAKAAVTAAR
jgi:uncharacterized coiled-coil DUF342 family protein